VYASSEPRFRPRLKGGCPRTICALCIPVSVPGLARYAVLPSPAPGSGPQVLLLSKLKAPINHAESTLLKVFFLKNLKPFAINTFEKQGGGPPLWLTNCYRSISPCGLVAPIYRYVAPTYLLYLPLLRKHPGGGGILPVLEPSPAVIPSGSEGSAFSFSRLVTRHSPLSFPKPPPLAQQ